MPYRVSPPLLPLTILDVEEDNPLSGKFLKYMPSNFTSGCFIAAITREVCLTFKLLGLHVSPESGNCTVDMIIINLLIKNGGNVLDTHECTTFCCT